MFVSRTDYLSLFLLVFFFLTLSACGGGSNSKGELPKLSIISPPSEITVTTANGENTITWLSAGTEVKSYQLYYREDINNIVGEYQSLNLVNQTKLTYKHTVTNGNQYTYKVSAINKENIEGSQSKESNTVTPLDTPIQPVFTSTLAEDASITLEWNTISGLSYKLNYQEAGGTINTIDTVTSPFIHTNSVANPSIITNGLEYTYTLIAIKP